MVRAVASYSPRVQAFPLTVWDKPPAPRHIGLALGGGAARGLAHIGVLEVLAEAAIPIHMVTGCSAGALVGALLAAGISAHQQHDLVHGLDWGAVSTLSLRLPRLSKLGSALQGLPLGLLDLDKLMEWMGGILGEVRTFGQLQLPFAAVATDIVSGELVIMNDGEIAPAVRASCSVPGIFTPFRRDGRLLVDGGVIANLPVQAVRQMGAEYVIAVDLLPMPGARRREPENIVDLALTSLYTLIRANQAYANHADCVIAPAIEDFSLVELSAAEDLIAAGRAAAEAVLPRLRADLALTPAT